MVMQAQGLKRLIQQFALAREHLGNNLSNTATQCWFQPFTHKTGERDGNKVRHHQHFKPLGHTQHEWPVPAQVIMHPLGQFKTEGRAKPPPQCPHVAKPPFQPCTINCGFG